MTNLIKNPSFGIVGGHPNVTITMHNTAYDRNRICAERPDASEKQLKQVGDDIARNRLHRDGATETRFFPREVA